MRRRGQAEGRRGQAALQNGSSIQNRTIAAALALGVPLTDRWRARIWKRRLLLAISQDGVLRLPIGFDQRQKREQRLRKLRVVADGKKRNQNIPAHLPRLGTLHLVMDGLKGVGQTTFMGQPLNIGGTLKKKQYQCGDERKHSLCRVLDYRRLGSLTHPWPIAARPILLALREHRPLFRELSLPLVQQVERFDGRQAVNVQQLKLLDDRRLLDFKERHLELLSVRRDDLGCV